MRALIVLAHPETSSFSAAVAEAARAGLSEAGHESDLADLVAENFDPCIRADDLAYFRGEGPLPVAARREQERIEKADALVLVFPIYWWGMPAILKGWIDRVFTIGWAFEHTSATSLRGLMRPVPMRILAIPAGHEPLYERHGYKDAFMTQIPHGILNFCGAKDVETTILYGNAVGADETRLRHLETARGIGRSLFLHRAEVA